MLNVLLGFKEFLFVLVLWVTVVLKSRACASVQEKLKKH